ncbi:GntR family transcriptional regulator [Halovulum sp. GXIMD14794]
MPTLPSEKPSPQLPGWARPITTDKPVALQLVSILRDAILHCELIPGQRLSEQEIADTMGLSRQPVREAFIRLSGEGLLAALPQRGTFVSRISTAEVLDSRFVREAVEADIVHLATRRADTALFDRLDALLEAQSAITTGDALRFTALDEDFHRTLAEAAGKTRAWVHIQGLKSQMDRVRFMVAADMPTRELVAQHTRVVEAIKAGDEDRAEAEMRNHLNQILRDLPKIMAAHADYFTDPSGEFDV